MLSIWQNVNTNLNTSTTQGLRNKLSANYTTVTLSHSPCAGTAQYKPQYKPQPRFYKSLQPAVSRNLLSMLSIYNRQWLFCC